MDHVEIEPAALTVAELLRVLPIGRTRAYEALRKGEIRSVRVAGRLLIPRAEIDRLLSTEAPAAAQGARG